MGLDILHNSKVYFDTNVFIYAIEDHVGYHDQIFQLFQHLHERNCKIVSSEITYAECLVKPLKEQDEESIRNYEKRLVDSKLIQLVPVTLAVLRHAAIFRAHYSTKLPDAIHVATAIEAGCSYLISNDRKLPVIEGLEFIFLRDIGS